MDETASAYALTRLGLTGPRTSAGPAPEGRPGGWHQAMSNRSRSITLAQAAAKSVTNFSFASSLA